MMEELRKAVSALAEKELASANAKFPAFHSLHEGYAVLREELDETTEAMNECITQSGILWQHTKANELEYAMKTAEHCRAAALNAACEAIQCAAMCQKLLAVNGCAKTSTLRSVKKDEPTKSEEAEFDTACRWVTKNVSDKKWPCGPDGEKSSDENCRKCLKMFQNAIKKPEFAK